MTLFPALNPVIGFGIITNDTELFFCLWKHMLISKEAGYHRQNSTSPIAISNVLTFVLSRQLNWWLALWAKNL